MSDPYKCTSMHYDPTLTQKDDGTVEFDWPDDKPDTCVVSKYVLVELTEELNNGRRLIAATRAFDRANLRWKADATAALDDWHSLEELVPAEFAYCRLGKSWPDVIAEYIRSLTPQGSPA